MNANKINLGGLWKQTSKEGKPYLSGSLGNSLKILVFPNDKKTADNQPDYRIVLAENERENAAPKPMPVDDGF